MPTNKMPLRLSDDRVVLAQAAQTLGLVLDSSTLGKLLGYRDLLLRWNRVYNLTAVREPADMLAQHLMDCLAIVPSFARVLLAQPTPEQPAATSSAPQRPRILDVGSGGGLPGVVLALLQPDWEVTCVDAVAKKAAFVRQVAVELALPNLLARHARVETLNGPQDKARYDVVTSRAFASLADFTRLTSHLIKPQGLWAAMKGQTPIDELAQLGAEAQLFHVEPLTVPGLAAQRCLVWIKPCNSDKNTS